MYALITGASSGIGAEFARQLAKEGYHLILVARRKDRLSRLKLQLEQTYSIRVKCLSYDLSKREECIHLYESCKSYHITLVINNAGVGKAGYSTNLSLEEELAILDTNITAVHILTKLFATTLTSAKILNVASIAAFTPIPIMAAYGASKSYVLQYSRAVNYELKKQKSSTRIAVLCPGPVYTEFHQVAGVTNELRGISTKQCVREALVGLKKGKEVIVPSSTTKLMRYLLKFAPTCLTLPIEENIQSKKLSK